MELQIVEEKDNALFGRKELKAKVISEVTPNRLQILDLISKKFFCPLENIKIIGIRGSFGTKTFIVEANIYSSIKDKNTLELKKKKEVTQNTVEIKKDATQTGV